ncbi:HlyD family efflux transporter periplasmic adaptor subunit [Xanthomonas phaseoli pv. dieffenbachiae]|uniref:AprE-like beta-barrel domain-containing protein n=1 Tax=Xanthomonas phaseoli pv. dieffenbachiae TaxID=92828 RepID=A0A1V9HDC0_9XANT|nr:HlyD family efflux transporter periplasmic adaptor subunit [Xanthomonas phaseoli pv. dieffenbachiae]MBO9775680.1 HlyD family efflux transporter periplasmic adaptor subunit [Xanthomonas phaseoli pv. dieffenbachiae]MBO9779618.1 HlyD family efflux transporter periplasmic adaptor subunit [Xanthomonas phaseoli pv. dieffenbachiae]MBO9787210.1 HlyD family efflux transporter periplasmic adaptor subunit [Xanthomonas phaseoli pv. dieffenbachiae]MBO9797599.1 HlyD family efflux transporter periplasmic a
MCLGSFTRHEAVNGALVPDRGLLTLTPLSAGIVSNAFVAEGARVRAGEPIVEISGEQDSTSLGDTQASVISQLEIKRGRLNADLQAQNQLYAAQQRDLGRRVALLQAQMDNTAEQIRLQRQRADSALGLYEQWVSAAEKGILTKVQLLQQQDIAIQNQAQLKELQKRALDLRVEHSQLQSQLEQTPATLEAKRNEIARQIADVAQSLSETEARRSVVLRAPTDGIVTNLLVHAGQPVGAQQPLITLLPKDIKLRAELWVPSRAVGFVTRGDRVLLRYQAFPYQKFGRHAGRVVDVSRSAISSKEVSSLLGQQIDEARYRVVVELESQHILANGRQESLRPGMALDADILLEKRRLIEWMFEPVYEMTSRLSDDSAGQRG